MTLSDTGMAEGHNIAAPPKNSNLTTKLEYCLSKFSQQVDEGFKITLVQNFANYSGKYTDILMLILDWWLATTVHCPTWLP